MDVEDDRIPVTLLTGFLGAGKTTVLNHLIQDPDAGRIAVIINEFGDVGIDHDLIEEATEETILMQSGRLCCSIRGDLLKTLGKLWARRNEGQISFDRVVIETTGIADPGPILHSLVVDQIVGPHFRMDGVVTLADAVNGPRTLDAQFEAVHQVAMADAIMISKSDLVTPHDLKSFDTRLAKINKTARRICTDHGYVLPGTLFGLSAMRGDVTSKDVSDWLGMTDQEPDPLAGLSGFTVNPQPVGPLTTIAVAARAQHHQRIVSASIEVETPIPVSVFDFWLDTLIALKGPDALRIKGIVHVEGMEWPFVFHGVQHIFDAPVPLESWKGTDAVTRVVVIARDMREDELIASLETLRLQPKEATSAMEGMMVHTTELSG